MGWLKRIWQEGVQQGKGRGVHLPAFDYFWNNKEYVEFDHVRGLGSMIAIELFEDGDHSKPDAKLTAEIVARARDKGLILLSCGPYYNVLRILVPLTIEDAQIRQGLEIIGQCFDEAKQ